MSDLRFGARMLARNPASTLVIAALLALGIGASTVIFSVFDAVLMRPLPVRHPEELVRMVQRLPTIGTESNFPDEYYRALRDHSTTLASVFEETADYAFTMSEPAPAEQVFVHFVTPQYFTGLGLPALLGRVLTPDDEKESPGTPPAVLSYSFWRRRFDANPQVIGKTIVLQGRPFAVVGVTPREFNGLMADTAPALRIPYRIFRLLNGRGLYLGGELAGRLKPGITRAQAEAECRAIWQGVKESSPEIRVQLAVGLEPLERGVSLLRDRFGGALKLLMASVSLLLLIVSTNVAGLLLARASARRQEIAVRLAIGATRARLVRQMLTEGLLLVMLGTIGGLIIAFAATPLAGHALPPIRDRATTLLPLSIDVRMNGRVLLFSIVVSALAMLLFSLTPAIAACRASLDSVLRGVRSTGRRRGWSALIVVQVAVCTLLLALASLFVRTLAELRGIDPGFDRDHIATFSLNTLAAGYTPEREHVFLQTLTERVKEIPGVSSVGIAARALMRGSGLRMSVAPEGQRITRADFLDTSSNSIEPEYFATMGMRILAGRGLTASDRTEEKPTRPVNVVVNPAFVARFFPNVDPVGKRFGLGMDVVARGMFEIVGVVSAAKYRSLREPIGPTMYAVGVTYNFVVLNVRTRMRPDSIIQPVQKTLASLDRALAFTEVHTMTEEIDGSTAIERLTAILASVFGALAALLAGVGIYGLLAFVVTQRRREIGIRMALGARPAQIGELIARQTIAMTAAGIVLGLGAALVAGRGIRALLYGLSPTDPQSLAAAAVLVAVVAAVATTLPARHATHVEPASVLRQEN